MGRRRIEIKKIIDQRARRATFGKRKSGLFKKAWEFGVLTGSKVYVVIEDERKTQYSFATNKEDLYLKYHDIDPENRVAPQDFGESAESPETLLSATGAIQMSPAQATVLGTDDYKADLITDAELVTNPKRGTAFDHFSRCYQARNWVSGIEDRSADLRFFTLSWEAEGDSTTNLSLCMLKVLPGGFKEMVSLNKPDKPDQANMTPEDAVLDHVQYLNAYSVEISIGATSVSDIIQESESIWWLSDLFEVSSRLKPFYKVNFCPDHWSSSNIQFRDQWLPDLLNCSACDGSAMWLLELAVLGNDEIIQLFPGKRIPKEEKLEYTGIFFHFYIKTRYLMLSDACLSPTRET
ncbi:hypothetical protein FOBRF1_013547 [Fusarium oxysporum]